MDEFVTALNLALPEIIIALGVMIVLVFGAFRGDKASGAVSLLSGATLLAAAFTAAFGPSGIAFSGSFVVDGVSAFAKAVMYVSAIVVIILGQGFFERLGQARFEFPVLVMLATLGMSMMVSAGDLIAMYIGIELQSLALYVLAAFRKNDQKSAEAGLKYFVLGALSSGLLLYGASLVYGFTGAMNFDAIAKALNGESNIGLLFGLVFLISGLGFKVSAAPFHMWTPDVYEGAPTPVVAFAAGAPKLAAMVLLTRLLQSGFGEQVHQWQQVVLALSVLSFLVGGLGGLMQKDFKRLLAYSSIANMGYALLAVAVSSQIGVSALLLFFVLYSIDTIGLFACQMALNKGGDSVTKIEHLAGLAKQNMPLTLAITVLVLSVLGLPPLGGFFAKFFVFGAALSGNASLWPFAAAGLVASVIAGFYYLRILKLMWFDAPVIQFDKPAFEAKWIGYAAAIGSFPVAMIALAALYPLAQSVAKAFGHG